MVYPHYPEAAALLSGNRHIPEEVLARHLSTGLPLHPLTGKEAKFVWADGHQRAFEAIKQVFVYTLVL